MVKIEDLKPGMRVKVIDSWPDGMLCDEVAEMDELLGEVVTVERVVLDDGYQWVTIEECPDWSWNKYCFDYIVYDFDDEGEILCPNMDALPSLIGGE